MAARALDPTAADGAYAPLAEINVTPFVDVMLVLLVVFMVTAPLLLAGVPVDLPRSSAARPAPTSKPLIVSLDRDGNVFVGDDVVPPGGLAATLAARQAQTPDAVVYVRGDRALPYGHVAELMGQVGQAGFARISLIAEAPPAGAPQP